MRQILIYSAILIGLLASPISGLAETLVAEGSADGIYEPAVAIEHRIEGESLILVLRDGADTEAIAALLRERLAQVEVTSDGQILTLSGVTPATLLNQLVLVDVTGDGGGADPLEELSALGGGLATNEQGEEGSSIRAGQPVAIAPVVVPHTKNERLVGQIIKVAQGAFPEVVIDFRVRWPIQAGPLKGKWKKGALVNAPVITSLVLESEAMQRNLVAYYLKPGDRVWVHLIMDDKGMPVIDWLERRSGKRK